MQRSNWTPTSASMKSGQMSSRRCLYSTKDGLKSTEKRSQRHDETLHVANRNHWLTFGAFVSPYSEVGRLLVKVGKTRHCRQDWRSTQVWKQRQWPTLDPW